MDQQNQQPAKMNFNVTGLIVKALPILAVVFLALAVLGLLYGFISGIVNAVQYSSFLAFVDGFANGIIRLGFNLFAAAVLSALHKLVTK